MNNSKKLNLNKYAFLFFLKGDFFCWINNDENYLKLAKNDEYLRNLSSWRWKVKGEKAKISDFEKPSTILDGLETSKYSKKYYANKYPDLKIIDLENINLKEAVEITNNYLNNKDNFIIFEGAFTYNEFSIRTDVLIKKNNIIWLIEVKAVTCPLDYHALDIMFQYQILKKLNYNLDNIRLRILTLNKNFILTRDINNDIEYLFKEWSTYFKTKPKSIEKAIEKNKDISIKEIINEEEYFINFEHFDETLQKIKEIQLSDVPPINNFEIKNFKGMDSEYEDYYLKLKGANESDSIFNYSGDSWFNKWKKAKYFDNGFTKITSLSNQQIISKSTIEKLNDNTLNWIYENPINLFDVSISESIKSNLEENSKLLKRLIQKNSFINNEPIIFKNHIKKHLDQYQKVIYMFDFETVQNAIPKNNNSSPYEQVPYQYSIHVILNKDDFDFKSMKNIVHLEWLATEKEFYEDFWKNFVHDIQKYGEGSYVSYNKSFENMIITNRLQKSTNYEEISFLNKLVKETIDLMTPFSNKWYYHNDFSGKYSIKLIAPHFAPEINYKNLDKRVQKGDQSAKQCKIWLIHFEKFYDDEWANIRSAMLKYCMYDTLSMVIIFQKLKEISERED